MWQVLMWLGYVVAFAKAREFRNPVIEHGKDMNPSRPVVSRNVEYYYLQNRHDGDIYASRDLEKWLKVGTVSNLTFSPPWAAVLPTTSFYIHVARNNASRIYFVRKFDSGSNKMQGIGVGISNYSRFGPYHQISAPLFKPIAAVIDTVHVYEDVNATYLYFSKDGKSVSGFLLHNDLLSAKGKEIQNLLTVTQPWESAIYAPFAFKRNDTYYIMYSSVVNCSFGSIGVARSSSPLGPFDKNPQPLALEGNKTVYSTSPSVVQGIDQTDVLIYELFAYSAQGCLNVGTAAKTINWVLGWPTF